MADTNTVIVTVADGEHDVWTNHDVLFVDFDDCEGDIEIARDKHEALADIGTPEAKSVMKQIEALWGQDWEEQK